MISKEERILAQPGDVFGIHYPSDANVTSVPLHSSHTALCCGVSPSDLSRFHNSEDRDDKLPIGAVIFSDVPANLRRLPALRPVLRGKIS